MKSDLLTMIYRNSRAMLAALVTSCAFVVNAQASSTDEIRIFNQSGAPMHMELKWVQDDNTVYSKIAELGQGKNTPIWDTIFGPAHVGGIAAWHGEKPKSLTFYNVKPDHIHIEDLEARLASNPSSPKLRFFYINGEPVDTSVSRAVAQLPPPPGPTFQLYTEHSYLSFTMTYVNGRVSTPVEVGGIHLQSPIYKGNVRFVTVRPIFTPNAQSSGKLIFHSAIPSEQFRLTKIFGTYSQTYDTSEGTVIYIGKISRYHDEWNLIPGLPEP